jgi:hypothetical protein
MPNEKIKHVQNTEYMFEDGIKYKLDLELCGSLKGLQAGKQTNLA